MNIWGLNNYGQPSIVVPIERLSFSALYTGIAPDTNEPVGEPKSKYFPTNPIKRIEHSPFEESDESTCTSSQTESVLAFWTSRHLIRRAGFISWIVDRVDILNRDPSMDYL